MARALMIAYTTYVHDARVKRHAQALAERGDQVDLLCLQNPQQGFDRGVNVIGLQIRRYRGSSRASYLRSYLRFFAAATIQAAVLSRRHRYDFAVVCTMPDLAVLCALPVRLMGSKLLLDVHDTMPELYRDKFGGRRGALGAKLLHLEERVSAGLADRVLAVHEPHRQRLIAAGIAAHKISVVLNVPDPRIFAPLVRPVYERERFTIVCHGTMAPRLGVELAIEAIARLRERLPTVRLRLIGGGNYVDGLRQRVNQRGLAPWIEFHAPVPLEQLPELLNEADVGLVPNRKSSATDLMLPVKLMEYVALGIPVIAARLHTIQYYFDDQAVRFFAPGDADGLAAAIAELHARPALRQSLAERACTVLRRVNWSVQRERYYEAIDSLFPNRRINAVPAPSEERRVYVE
ncbi:MAG TPA: glycosyltransferase family 4 protein [Candidatus Binataceae bacterium]|nr:glycosyltransferase family 4 protein [Candidatus Binataceae bacterium]